MTTSLDYSCREERLADYTQQRAKSPISSPTSSTAGLNETPEVQPEEEMEVNDLSPTTQLRNAISTTEFLLNLPLEAMKNDSNQDGDKSMLSSMSSLGSSFMLGGFSDAGSDAKRLSCSEKLKLSMRSLVKQNSGRDMHFSFGSLKSGLLDIDEAERQTQRDSLRRTQTADSALSGSTRSLVSLIHDLEADDPSEEWAQKSRASINFPLRRSLSTGMRFERTPSQRSLASTDRLRRSLSNTI